MLLSSVGVAPLQRLIGRRLLLRHLNISNKFKRIVIKQIQIQNCENWLKRSYSSSNEDKKILAPAKIKLTKTTVNTLSESKALARKEDSKNNESKIDELGEQQKSAETTNPTNPKPITKTIQVETTKGLLSVTTTIEDSKINDIILEKTKSVPPKNVPKKTEVTKIKTTTAESEAKSKQTTLTSDETNETTTSRLEQQQVAISSVIEKNKAKKAAKLQEAKSEVMCAAASAADVAKTTVSSAKSTVASAAASLKDVFFVTKKDSTTNKDANIETKPKPRIKVDFNRSSLERNFITPARAMSDFLLTPADLEHLPKIKRRSPYEREPPMTVYWRKDVEAKAIEVWGSRENLLKERLKRELERKQHQQNIFTVKRRLRDYRREIGYRTTVYENEPGLRGKSGQVVLIAIGINSMNFLFKTFAWLYTGSHSMFAEAIHSLADTINQLILAYGIHKSTQSADSDHPYGYSNMRYVSSLISGVGIFCVGTGLSVYHGITGLMHPEPMSDFFWAFFILGGSLVSEGATLLVAINEIRRSAKLQGVTFKDYVFSGKDPCVNVVLTEDAAAVASVGVAAACMGLAQISGSPVFDAMGSLFVGGILGAVASFIIYTNVQALVGKSIPEERLNKINSELESDVMIRAIHDVKGIDMGNSLVRYKAELDFDGRELTRSYLDKQDLNELLKVVKSFQTVDELEQFLLTHGENIVDLMGGEIDRIEMKLRKKFPEIRHCDLEIL